MRKLPSRPKCTCALAMRRNAMSCHRKGIQRNVFGTRAVVGTGCAIAALCSLAAAGAGRGHRSNTLIPREFFEGKELFEKSWEPGKPSPIGGDGVGPLYNEVSCVGCHHQGGTGGGGENKNNVEMVTA